MFARVVSSRSYKRCNKVISKIDPHASHCDTYSKVRWDLPLDDDIVVMVNATQQGGQHMAGHV